MEEISFIHAADLHLDSSYSGLTHVPEHIFSDIKESSFRAFDQLVKVAIKERIDFILLVGDLFDNEKQTLKAQIKLRNAFLELEMYGIDVYLSYGNHDYLNGNIHTVTYPKNVHIFASEEVRAIPFFKNNRKVANIYGFSYQKKRVNENKALAYVYEDEEVPFHIAMLHGSVKSNTTHDVYAPFQLSDLMKTPFDYWALGHIHKREILKQDPLIVYPGNLQGRNRKETGEKGFYYVELSDISSKLSFIPVETIQFNTIELEVNDSKAFHEIETKLHKLLEEKKYSKPQLLTLHLISTTKYLTYIKQEGLIDELIELLNESLSHQDNWLFIIKYTTESKPMIDEEEIAKGDHFISELVRNNKQKKAPLFITSLFDHRQGRKYLEPLTDVEERYIREEAEQLLLYELLKGSGEIDEN